MTPDTGWLSATSAGRLLHCPASAAFALAPKAIAPSSPDNAGILAHLAMGAWLESGAWLNDEPGRALQSAWDREALRWEIDAKRLRDSVITRSRLRSRGAELAGLLQAAGGSARSEVFLQDEVQMLFGQVDVVVDDPDKGAVVDLKTGVDGHSEGVRTQLLIYAHLFRQNSGHLPGSLIAFSLVHGPVHIDFSHADIDELLARVQNARQQPALALPEPSGCRYCRRRLECEPHWEAATAWAEPDCVEGVVSKVEIAAAGLTAVRIDTASGEQWVTGLISSPQASLSHGANIRVTEVGGRGEGVEREWRATRLTRWTASPR